MADFCKIDFRNLNQDSIEEYNAYVDQDIMDNDMFEITFSGIPEVELNTLKSELFQDGKWKEINEEFIKNHTVTENKEGTPENSGDPSLNQYNQSNYNAETLNSQKVIISRFITSTYILGKINEEFRDWLFKNCIYDYEGKIQVANPNEISERITNYKLKLCEELISTLGLDVELNSVTDENLTKSIQDVLNAAESKIQNESSQNVKEARKAFYKLVYFDDMIKSLDFVERDTSVPSYKHKKNMYIPKFGNDNIRKSWNQDETAMDMDEITSNFTKEFMNYLPLVNKNGMISSTMKVGWNAFQRSVTTFMNWVKESLDPGVYEQITNGNLKALNTALGNYLEKGTIIGSVYNEMINSEVLRSLQKFIFNESSSIPKKIQNLFFTQILKTAKHAYLGYDYDSSENTINLNLIEDKAIRSESSRLTNIIVSRIKTLRQNQELRNEIVGKADSKFTNVKVDTTVNPGVYTLSFTYNSDSEPSKDYKFIINKIQIGSGKEAKNIWKFNVADGYNIDSNSDSNFKNLIYDLFGYNLGLPETTEDQDVVDSFINETLTSGKTLLNIFSDPIGITLLGIMSTIPTESDDYRGSINFPFMGDSINLKNYFKNYDDLAKFQYWCAGYDNKNVVRDIKGDKVPVYALISAIYQYDSLLYKANKSKGVNGSIYESMASTNPILNGDIKAKAPLIRNGIATSLGKKSASQMTAGEYIITSAFIDYGQSLLFDSKKKVDGYRAHRLLDGNTVMIQFTVFSDKSQQFVIPFTFSKNSTLLKSLKALAKDKNSDAEKALSTYIYNWQKNKYLGILNNIASKYSKVYGVSFKPFSDLNGNIDVDAIEELNSFIKDKCKNKELLREDFKRAGVDLVDEIDFSSGGLNTAFIEKLTNVFNSQESTEYYLEKQKRVLIQDLVNNNVNLYDNAVNIPQISEDWKENRKIKLYKVYQEINGKKVDVTNDVDEDNLLIDGEVNPEYSIELNPILNSWLYADGICSQSYEEVFFGLNENNPNKSAGEGESRISGRLLAHYKRTVPAGSTVHLYMQGLNNGVPEQFRAAVIDDLYFAYATNSIGEIYKEKPHDGGALCNPIYAIWARNSLGSAAAGTTMAKTIHHDVDEYGNGILCKWATYTITNAIRRNSQNSSISMERLHKKMNNISIVPFFTSSWFNTEETLNEILKENGEIWVNDIFGKPKKIVNIKVNNFYGTPTITVNYETEDGSTSSKTFGQNGLTVYDLDQVFGGAWIQKKQNGVLDYVENLQNEMVVDFLTRASEYVNYDIKEKVISYLINTSAIKRGAVNINDSQGYYDDEDFSTMMISTKYGGLMMDSEHNVDGHVREMSQIMASLVQNGYSEEEAKKIYSDIGKIIETTATNLFDGTSLSSDERKNVIERMLIRALKVSKTGGIGASDAIILYADREIKGPNGKILRQAVPFSLSDIKNKFQATVNAYLTNEALIRQYPGLQAVNTPSRGIIQYYKFNNGIFNYESAVKWVKNEMTDAERYRLAAFFDEPYLDYNDETVIRHAFKPYKTEKTYELFNKLSYFLGRVSGEGKHSYLEFKDKYGNLPHGLFENAMKEIFKPLSDNPAYIETYNSAISQLYELSHTTNPEMITDFCEGQFLKKVWDPRDLQIGQSIIVKRKGDKFFRKITLESAYQRDIWVNLEDFSNVDIYRIILAPEDLKQPQLQIEVKTENEIGSKDLGIKTEWDLDVVRAMYYFRELNSKDPSKIQFYDKKINLVDKVLNKIYSFGNKYNFSRHAALLINSDSFYPVVKDKNIQGQIIKILRAYQQEIYYQLKQKGTLTSQDEILGLQESFNFFSNTSPTNKDFPEIQSITFKEVTPGEIAVSAAYAKEFMIKEGDDLGQILKEGANFFRKRLPLLSDISNDLNPDQYDAVLLDKLGNQIVVKVVKPNEIWNPVDENGESLFYEDEEGVDRQSINVLYNGNTICSNKDWDAKKIKIGKIARSQKGKPYKIIVLQDINDLKLFEDSSQFNSKETTFNFTRDNVKMLFGYAKNKLKKNRNGEYGIPLGIHKNYIKEKDAVKNLTGLQNWQREQSENYLNRRSELLAKNFEKTLLYFGTRIPSQAMQSGMSLKVVTFVGNGGNQVFIPGAMHWFEGADYDIDKTYMMRLGLNNGYLDILSDLYEDFGDKCTTLSIPNKNISYEVSEENLPDQLSLEVRNGLANNNGRYFYNGIHYVNASALMDSPDYTSNNDEMFKSIKKILNDSEQHPDASKNIIVVNDNNYEPDVMDDLTDLLGGFLKKHNSTKMDNSSKVAAALMNRNVINAYEILRDPLNFISASDPISFGEIKEYAKNSTLGGREKYVSIWNGSSKGIMQEQFMLGKDEIGIIATSIKSYLQKTNVVNAAVLRAADSIRSRDLETALKILDKYCFKVIDLNGIERLGILANINLRPLYEALTSLNENKLFVRNVPTKFDLLYNNPDGTFNFKGLLDDLSEANAKEDVLMALSALLSAATDNAKELILSKINASQSTIDLFCSMLGTGYSIKEILDVFSSPWFTLADTLMKNNLYAQSDNTKTLGRVIDFITGNSTLLSGKYQQRFIELLNCEEFLYKTTDSGAQVFRFNKPAKDYYEKYLKDLQDPNSSYQGNKDSKDPMEQKSTIEKRLEFANMLLIGENYKEALKALEDFYNKVEAREKILNAKKRKFQGNDDDQTDDYYDSLMQIDEGSDFDFGFDDLEPDFGQEPEPEPDIDDPDMITSKKTRIIKNLTFRDFTLEDVNTIRAYLDDVKFKNKMANRIRHNGNQNISVLTKIKENVIPVSDENKILGKMNKCNQGLVSSSEDLYNFTKAIEIYFNNELRKVPEEKRREGFPDKFSLEEFLTNEVTQKTMIELFDELKHESNVLRMMKESDNFWNMFKIYKFAIENSKIQYNTDLTWKLINNVLIKIYGKDNAYLYHKVNNDQYKIINSVVSDALVFGFLKSLPENQRVFKFPKGVAYYPTTANQFAANDNDWTYDAPVTSSFDGTIDIGTASGSATFKRWMDTTILHQLKARFKDNAFIRNLHTEEKFDPIQKQGTPYLTIGIDMTNISNSTKLKSQFNTVKLAYDLIADEEIEFYGNTMKLKDMLYLYNLIQNKGVPTSNSFNALFGDHMVKDIMNNDTIMNKHWTFLNNLDTLKTSKQRDIFESNFMENLVKDSIWRLASNLSSRIQINAQSEENVIKPITSKIDNRLIGFSVDKTSIYLIGGDFRFNLPFTSGVVYNQKPSMFGSANTSTHFFSEKSGSASRIRTKTFLTEALQKYVKLGYIKILDGIDDWKSVPLTDEEKNSAQNWSLFAHDGIFYINMNTIDELTPARVLVPLMSIVANNYKDKETGKYVYKDMWNNLLKSLKDNQFYDHYYKRTFNGKDPNSDFFKSFAGTSTDELVLATYITDQLITNGIFESEESKSQTDADFNNGITAIVNILLGLKMEVKNLPTLSFANLGQIIKGFGTMMNDASKDFKTTVVENANMRNLIRAMINNNKLTISGNC